ncbi:MAG: phage holin family protein [Bacillota bacterium]
MKRLALRILVNTAVLYVIALVYPPVAVVSIWAALLGGTVLALLNALLRPLLLLITLPVNLITLGLFTLVVNAWMLILTDRMIGGIAIPGFWLALLVALLITLVNLLLGRWFRNAGGQAW